MRGMVWSLALCAILATAHAETLDVEGGSYEARTPRSWEGETPLRLLIFLHGYGATGVDMLENTGLAAVADRHGALLVAPNGLADARGRASWSHRGLPMQRRDAHAFLRSILADVRARFPPVDEPPTIAGFSQGGSMVWDLACSEGAALGRYVAIAGGFWMPMPATCRSPVGVLTHVHGTSDPVVPMAGRPIGGQWRQGDVVEGWKRFEAAAGCTGETAPAFSPPGLTCRVSTGCAAGELRFCVHDGGHHMELRLVREVLGRGP